MSNRMYETAVLMNAALEDDQIQSIISRIKETITNNGGEIKDFEDWGRKRLAYIVKKNKIGYYVIFRFTSPPVVLSKLDRLYKLDDNILRYLTIKLSKAALEQIEINKRQTAAQSAPVIEKTEVTEVVSEENDKETIKTEQNQ